MMDEQPAWTLNPGDTHPRITASHFSSGLKLKARGQRSTGHDTDRVRSTDSASDITNPPPPPPTDTTAAKAAELTDKHDVRVRGGEEQRRGQIITHLRFIGRRVHFRTQGNALGKSFLSNKAKLAAPDL